MNQHPKYEQTIAGKLQSLPVPDMADAIWSRIEAQLDIDLPTNDGGGNNPPSSSPSGPGIMGWGLSIVVVALISIFLLSKNKKDTNSNQISNPIKENIEQPVETANDPPPRNTSNNQPVNSTTIPVIDNTANATQDTIAAQQSVTGVSVANPDSSNVNKEPLLVSIPTPVANDTVPANKKRRGVSGLTDNDYRIEPTKKDN